MQPPRKRAAEAKRARRRARAVTGEMGLGAIGLCGNRQLDAEGRTAANLRSKVYRTVVKLHNSKSANQADSAPARSRSEKELEDFLAMLGSNALASVADRDFRHLAAPRQDDAKLAAAGHGFYGVEDEIQH